MMNETNTPKRPSMHFFMLDLLRGIAALWVFAFHHPFSVQFQTVFPVLKRLFDVGHLGVPMFFVISGYCITASARSVIRKHGSTGSFLYRRMKRIYPPFWCSIAIVASLPFLIEFVSFLKTGNYLEPTAVGNKNFGYLEYGLGDWIRLATLTQIFHPMNVNNLQAKFTTINAVYWTLAIEVQFYVVVAGALWTARRAFYPALLAVTVASIPFALAGPSLSGVFLSFWPMFAIGILLFFLLERGWSLENLIPGFANAIAIFVTIAAGVMMVLFAIAGRVPDGNLFAFAFALFLWCVKPLDQRLMLLNEHPRYFLLIRPCALLGLMSYSIYLLHGRLQYLTAQFVRQVIAQDSIAYDLAVIGGTCLLCWPFYKYCEAPFLQTQPSSAGSSSLAGQPLT